jgi:hypothetical protein
MDRKNCWEAVTVTSAREDGSLDLAIDCMYDRRERQDSRMS